MGGAATAQRLSSIVDLEDAIASLPADTRAVADRLFTVATTTGRLVAPPEMHAWITKLFGSVDAVARPHDPQNRASSAFSALQRASL